MNLLWLKIGEIKKELLPKQTPFLSMMIGSLKKEGLIGQ
jgi:hypothetical protein